MNELHGVGIHGINSPFNDEFHKSGLGLVWVSLMKLMNLFHGIW